MAQFWSDNYDFNEMMTHIPSNVRTRNTPYVLLYNGKVRSLSDILTEYDAASIIDYGCGESTYISEVITDNNLQTTLTKYDPFITQYNQRPAGPADIVSCHNVLGLVEQAYMEAVINDIWDYTSKAAIFVIPFSTEDVGAIYMNQVDSKYYLDYIVALPNSRVKEVSVFTVSDLQQVLNRPQAANANLKFLYALVERI